MGQQGGGDFGVVGDAVEHGFEEEEFAFGVELVAYDPYIAPARAAQLGIELLTFDELLGCADIISIHLPKTPETIGLIGKDQLALTKPGVIVVNAADLLTPWSSDTIKSTKHRVVEPPKPAEKDWHPSRYSIAYFCNPNL